MDAALKAATVEARGAVVEDVDILAALSIGTRDQLATLIRLTIASQLQCAIVLDDHLVNTDPARLAWFRAALIETARRTQVIVLTCRPHDYLREHELPSSAPSQDFELDGERVRAIDLNRVIVRWSITNQPA